MTTQVKVNVNGNYHAEVTITSDAGDDYNHTAIVEGGKDGPTERTFSLPHGNKTTFVVDERQMTPEEVATRDAPPNNIFD